MSSPTVYEPGVCNIGPTGRVLRRRHGYGALAIAAAMWVTFALSGTPPLWRLSIFFPAAWSASAFLEVYAKFCVAYGVFGLFETDGRVRRIRANGTPFSRIRDRRTALKIVAQGAAIGAAAALMAYLTAR